MLTPDNSSSSSEEPPDIPDFGECMFCHARGFVHTNCNECHSMFYPLSASPPEDDSSGIQEQQEEHDPALDHVRCSIMEGFNTDRVSDDMSGIFFFCKVLVTITPPRGKKIFFVPLAYPRHSSMFLERTESGKRHGHYNAAGAVRDVTTSESSIAEQLP